MLSRVALHRADLDLRVRRRRGADDPRHRSRRRLGALAAVRLLAGQRLEHALGEVRRADLSELPRPHLHRPGDVVLGRRALSGHGLAVPLQHLLRPARDRAGRGRVFRAAARRTVRADRLHRSRSLHRPRRAHAAAASCSTRPASPRRSAIRRSSSSSPSSRSILFASQMLDRMLDGDDAIRDAALGFVAATTLVAAVIALAGFTPLLRRRRSS